MHIYVMRHGQSVANAHKIVSGTSETPLSNLGREQARQAGEAARALGIDYIVCSPLKRAHDTATIVAEAIGYPAASIHIMSTLRERHQGKLEGGSYAKNIKLSGDFIETNNTAGMEQLGLFHSRVQHVLRQLLADTQHKAILVVCHNNVIRMLHTVAHNQPAEAMYDQPRLENGRIMRLL